MGARESILTFEAFCQEFKEIVEREGINWEIRGLLRKNNKVHVFGSDTKVLSTVFELLCTPFVTAIATRHEYAVEPAPQTVYPDFTLLKSGESKRKIAIDVKTTYRRGARQFRYTLGSYTSFLRNGTKNILYPYDHYSDHWVIGFLYTRVDPTPDADVVVEFAERLRLTAPYKDVEWFVQEKHKIVGESPASGNTTNIGSFPTADIEDLRRGRGPFAALGKEVCDEYWRNFDRESSSRRYRSLAEYQRLRDRGEL